MGAPNAAADAILVRAMRQADRLVTLTDPEGRRAARTLLQLLVDADRDLKRRMRAWNRAHGGGRERASYASLLAYHEQVAIQTRIVQGRLLGLTSEQALRTSRVALERSARLISSLEEAFTGIAVPVRTDEALIARLQPSLLQRHATSVDRYGASLVKAMEQELATGFASGLTQGAMVDRLVSLRGPTGLVSLRAVEVAPGMVVRLAEETIPEGLFVRHRSWAWRIVRTECAEGQGAATLAHLEEVRRTDFDDMQKRICATFDKRTAYDSMVVHGQIRPLDGLFEDGAGRTYERPPARPHDREVLIGYRASWPDTEHSRPRTQAEIDRMWSENETWQAERQRRRSASRRRLARKAAA